MAGWRPSYSLEEDCKIIRYICNKHYGRILKGDKMWKQMEEKDLVPGRTWQSMKNRWLKYISVNLDRKDYEIPEDERNALKADMVLGGQKLVDLEPKKTPGKRQSENDKDDPNLGEQDKEFYSLNMDWSGDDTD